MRHAKPYRKLSRQRSHYRALMRNMALSLFMHERIRTTVTKAKEVRRFIDKIIGLGKSGTAHDRRRAFALMGNKLDNSTGRRVDVLEKVFGDLAKRYSSRRGGYTRIIKAGVRPGDASPMAWLELVDGKFVSLKKKQKTETTAKEPEAAA